MPTSGEDIENLLMDMVLENKTLIKKKSKNTHFHAFVFRNGLNIFQVMTMTYGTKIVLFKLDSMNHCHYNYLLIHVFLLLISMFTYYFWKMEDNESVHEV
jgi:hypothetical protein